VQPPSGAGSPGVGGGRRPRLSRPKLLGLGLLLTLAGLFLLSDLLPTGVGALERALPVAAAGLLTLWIGGLLLGRGGRA
jgi:hypothetical protein